MNTSISELKIMLGNRIRALRSSRGLTQQELAELCSLNYKYLGGIERGERNPTFENLAKIASGLGIELHRLFIFEHESPDIGALKKKLNEILERSPDEDVRKAFRVIQGFVE